jgi:hypothetical protein
MQSSQHPTPIGGEVTSIASAVGSVADVVVQSGREEIEQDQCG